MLTVSRSLGGRRWVWRDHSEQAGLGIAQLHGLPEIVGRLLAVRGVAPGEAAHFLAPTLRAMLPDPSCLQDMDAAAERLAEAVRRQETVAVFGDYDVDGACSAALMTLLLRELGCTVLPYVPDRLAEGYGPNGPALRGLAVRGATLVVCVDCGTAGAAAFAAVAGQADVVVLDHHRAEGALPAVHALVNPNRPDDRSGLGGLCATAIAFLAAVATIRALRRGGLPEGRAVPDLLALLDLVALATVCDVMPLVGLNRALVCQGLKVLANRRRPGIAALLDVAQVRDAISSQTCGYSIGPRINAAGRISTPDLGLRLLLAAEPSEAAALAAELDALNRTRQHVEAGVLDRAMAIAAEQAAAGAPVLFVAGADWHQGVVGIVAGRIKERFNRPTCVVALAGGGEAKGSARSVPSMDLGAAIAASLAAGIIRAGGGHAMAAGFTLEQSRLPEFQAFLCDRLAAAASLPVAPDLMVEGTVSLAGAGPDLAQHLVRLAPFGAGNEEPVLVVPHVRIVRSDRVGREGKTVRAYAEGEGGAGKRLKIMRFRAENCAIADAFLARSGTPMHVAGHLRAEAWEGRVSAVFVATDAALAG